MADKNPAPATPATPATPTAASDERNDTGYTPGEDSGTRWSNWFSLLLGRMTEEGKAQYVRDRDLRYEASDCARCEKYRDFVLQYSPTVRFMSENIQKLGGDLSRDNVQCRRCELKQVGGFDPEYGIMICANHIRNQGHVEDTIAHEMVHAWDHLRYNVDWGANLRHAACTEIRASSLSGECRFMREFWTRGQWKLNRQHQECVKRRAVISVQARPFCKSKEQAERVVDEVWDSCFKDTRPFDEIYK